MKTLSIREFNTNLCKILESVVTTKEGIVVTKFGKPYIVVTIPKENVVTTSNVVTTPEQNVTTPEKIYCFACRKLGRTKEATGEYEITFEHGERRVFLCDEHKKKYLP